MTTHARHDMGQGGGCACGLGRVDLRRRPPPGRSSCCWLQTLIIPSPWSLRRQSFSCHAFGSASAARGPRTYAHLATYDLRVMSTCGSAKLSSRHSRHTAVALPPCPPPAAGCSSYVRWPEWCWCAATSRRLMAAGRRVACRGCRRGCRAWLLAAGDVPSWCCAHLMQERRLPKNARALRLLCGLGSFQGLRGKKNHGSRTRALSNIMPEPWPEPHTRQQYTCIYTAGNKQRYLIWVGA